jgi:DNA-binding NtrC family response regulator
VNASTVPDQSSDLALGRAREGAMMSPATVLVIEDLEDVRTVLAELLRFEPYQLLTASSVEEAEAVCERLGPGALDLVVTNVRLTHLPDAREGVDLILRWHAVEPHLPFILMSGDLRPQDIADLPSEVVWYIAKPFSTEVFLAIIREAIGR